MSAQVQHVRLHTKEGAQQIIADAWEIALDATPHAAHVVPTFEKACDLLAAGVVLTPQPSMGLGNIDLSKLRG